MDFLFALSGEAYSISNKDAEIKNFQIPLKDRRLKILLNCKLYWNCCSIRRFAPNRMIMTVITGFWREVS
jgi:hypothetical protein